MKKLTQEKKKRLRSVLRLPAVVLLSALTLAVILLSGNAIRKRIREERPRDTRREAVTERPKDEYSDFGGFTVTVLYSDAERTHGFLAVTAPTLMARGDSEEIRALEMEYGLVLDFSKSNTALESLNRAAASGDPIADILVLPIAGELSDLLSHGQLEDLSSKTVMDLSHPAYDGEAFSPAPVGGKRYLLTGAFLVGYRDAASAVVYDRAALSAFYQPGQLPSVLAADGKWTYDAMTGFLAEMNGSVDEETSYFLMRVGEEEAPFFWISSGADPVGKNADGTFAVRAREEDPLRRLTLLRERIFDSPYHTSGNDGSPNVAFAFTTLGRYGEMDRERYAILPMPKLEEELPYRSAVLADRATAAAVPKGAGNTDRAAAALDILFCRSYERYRGEYAADLCGRDREDNRMLPIILSGTVLGPLDEFGYGEILYSVVSEAVTRTGDGSYPTEKSILKKLKERGNALEFAINVLSDKALENNANP